MAAIDEDLCALSLEDCKTTPGELASFINFYLRNPTCRDCSMSDDVIPASEGLEYLSEPKTDAP